jgi:hypothetical protein
MTRKTKITNNKLQVSRVTKTKMQKTQLAFPTSKGHAIHQNKTPLPHSQKETAKNCSTTKIASTTSGTDSWI